MASLLENRSVILALLLINAVPALAQSHKGHSSGMTHGGGSMDIPIETGQSAFAAVAEIVAILDADENTDWSTVSIDALRDHLVDMDRMMLESTAETKVLDDRRIEFQVRGSGQTLNAIHAMVPAHANMVREITDWQISVERQPNGANLTVEASSPEALTRLKSLGFFGFMTLGAHHQAHHLQMATGQGH